ncbi:MULTISPECIES: iron uptake system protein EfeO [unclassified Nocardioides]|uniref:iron uptake system protein EfeO n=1 Tax=unclassified Nocardioides TaxID=2615069 RepID=UPI0006F6A53E|nr:MULTISPECIES: iron uptake system protein EfeO [unclassified Nocardioides]KQY63729.1 PbrT family lead (Pb2+) uptake porter [Nocardioides sp. Root140]KRF15744.1 PbrT family lead (Pb2+) uptake porter [Nocardioides sp. Soil796]
MRNRRLAVLVPLLVAAPLVASCTENTEPDEGNPRSIQVVSTEDGCDVSKVEAPAGTLTFDVTNAGKQVTEFYLLAEDGLRIIGEVENIGENLDSRLTVQVPEGKYVTACKPGMKGDGIRSDFAVTASDEKVEVTEDEQALVDTANANYLAYVQDQTDQLLTKTTQFVNLYKAGKDDEARALYADARVHWERIEPVAESFGDLDPKMDLREADVAEGDDFTGWHRIEKDLWPARAEGYKAMTPKQRAFYADDLLKNTKTLDTKVDGDLSFTIDGIANGATGLLEEVAEGKVTGEEEFWSRTDLWDFQANVDGARVAFEGVKPLLETKDAALSKTLTDRFAALQKLLDAQRTDSGFTYYNELTQPEIKALKVAVEALAEPLSKLTGTILSRS